MSNKFLDVRKVFFLTLLIFFLFYAFLAAPFWVAQFRYRSLSGSGVGYVLPGRRDELPTEETITIKPVSEKFGLVIPKIGVNKKLVANVDLYETERLLNSLDGSLVHMAGSAVPSRFGSVVVMGHSPSQLINSGHLNPDFYLLNKLETGDLVYLFYDGVEFLYKVSSVEFKSPTYFDFFESNRNKKLILVSGWPPGTSLRLLVVEAEASWE